MPVTINLRGLAETIAALQATVVRVEQSTADATYLSGQGVLERAQMNLSRYSHARGTPTPSPRGEPPARIDGHLHDSVKVSLPRPIGPATWECSVSSALPYSRIQETGGWAGRGRHSYLPPRPYLRPAADTAVTSGLIRTTFEREWAKALRA